jgi:hypothetical protein
MTNFEIFIGEKMYYGTFEVLKQGLELSDVKLHWSNGLEIRKKSKLKEIEEAIEIEHSEDIADERAQLGWENRVSVAESRRDEY